MIFFVLVITACYHIVVLDTRVHAILLLTQIWDPQLGNPRGTLLKQSDQNLPGPTGQKCGQYLGKMWAEAVTHMWNPHSTWDPYETGGQKPYGPHMSCSYVAHIVVQMGPMWGHVFVLTWFISKSLSKLNEDSSL